MDKKLSDMTYSELLIEQIETEARAEAFGWICGWIFKKISSCMEQSQAEENQNGEEKDNGQDNS